VSPSPNWSPKGRTAKDLSIRHVRAPQSASEVHGFKAWQPVAWIGHPLSLPFLHPSRRRSFAGERSFPLPWPVEPAGSTGRRSREKINVSITSGS